MGSPKQKQSFIEDLAGVMCYVRFKAMFYQAQFSSWIELLNFSPGECLNSVRCLDNLLSCPCAQDGEMQTLRTMMR
jgi:hypothetical protein